MKFRILGCLFPVFFILILFFLNGSCKSQKGFISKEKTFYRSLHYTNKGMEYWYAKEQGGAERITGIPAGRFGCLSGDCHIKSCDACHLKKSNGEITYSLKDDESKKACLKCHSENKDDVHALVEKTCMDCHNLREVHGDSIEHNTYMKAGFFDTKCENCHRVSKSASHRIHKNSLDCKACHMGETKMCANCHLGNKLKTGKSISLQMKNVTFLVNHNGKIKPANFLSCVYENKAMIIFAPSYNHFIKREGRKCDECHGNQIIQNLKNQSFQLAKWENNELKNVEGVIPVLANMDYNMIFFDYVDGKWIPLNNHQKTLINYSGYCSPLSREQFEKLTAKRSEK